MNIEFKKIELHNFMSFTDAKLDLNREGTSFITGKNLNIEDNSESNGSLKSSIIEAIVFALTGQTLRGSKAVLKQGEKEGYVTLWFTIDNDEYEITRSIS